MESLAPSDRGREAVVYWARAASSVRLNQYIASEFYSRPNGCEGGERIWEEAPQALSGVKGLHIIDVEGQRPARPDMLTIGVPVLRIVLKKGHPYRVLPVRAFCSFSAALPEKVLFCHGGSAPQIPGLDALIYPYHVVGQHLTDEVRAGTSMSRRRQCGTRCPPWAHRT